MKFKIFEIVLSLLSPNSVEKGTAINFLYAFLPSLLPLVVSDIQCYFIKKEHEGYDDKRKIGSEKSRQA
jgi:hypothetical protein